MNDKLSTLRKKYTPMTSSQLKIVVSEYAENFRGWEITKDGNAFVRCAGPIQQVIWFQKMGSAAYRPTHGVISLILPACYIRMLPQTLDVKHREVEYRWHQQKMPSTVAAMERQFQPNIRKSLDIDEVMMLCESEAGKMPDTVNNMAMLAILSGWLGRDSEVLHYCDRAMHGEPVKLAPIPEWEEGMRIFCQDLAESAKAGCAQEFLNEALKEGAR